MEKNGKTSINYLFFSFLLLFLIALTFSHFLRIHPPLWGVPLYFLAYALGQAVLEVLCFMLLGYALHRWLPQWTFKIFIGLSFGLLLAHFVNYTLVRLMDVSLSYFFKFFFGCGIDHFRVAFLAMNLNSTIIAIIIGLLILVPIAGIGFYWATHRMSNKLPLMLSQKQLFSAVAILSLLLLALDIIAKPYLTKGLYDKYSKTLPLGSTFLSPTLRTLSLPSPIPPARNESILLSRLAEATISTSKHPNIYLFVIETLRRDFVSSSIAPNMCAFADENISSNLTLSNANSTHLSWFAIFHSDFPYNWTEVRDHWTKGSIPLQLFKKMGYRIRVYSSADLTYFNMDQVIFGKNRQIADSVKEYSTLKIEPCDRDDLAMKAAAEDMAKEADGTLFIVFLDSTHSEYSTPLHFSHPFQPAAVSIDYLAIGQSSKDLELLKNRYRNSIHWVDHLLGRFFQQLKDLNLYNDAVIAITGDHGEEFFEDGALFHGTHLNDYQTRVPLFYKLQNPPGSPSTLSSHIDIMPSILHSITGQADWSDYVDGQSIFIQNRWPYVLSVQHNGPDVPYEFLLSDGENKLMARFLNPPLIHSISSIELLSWETKNGKETSPSEKEIAKQFNLFFTAPNPAIP